MKYTYVFLCILLWCCSASNQESSDAQGLKAYYSAYFPIGASVAPSSFSGLDSALIVSEFNNITPENIMKMGRIQPEEGAYYWQAADEMMVFAKQNNLKIRGHALCWHRQVGDWMFENEDGTTVHKELLLERLRQHIYAVAGRYKNQIYAWDVVNEAISDDSSQFLRPSKWYKIAGEDYIEKAFQFAHEAAPNALLFYNDYNAVQPRKRDKIIRLIQQLQSKDIPIHGVGIQAHWNIYSPSDSVIRAALDAYKSLGLQVQITELDVSVYRWNDRDTTN